MTILHVNAKAAREIDWAIDEIAYGKVKQGLQRLCLLRGRPLPEIRQRKPRVKLPPIAVTPAFVRAYNGPLPKPRKRIVDRKALRQYCAERPHCEILGCFSPPCPEPHHLISRKMRGDDAPGNLLRLCADHHREWHRGPATWAQRYIHQLTAEARSKVMTALRTPEDAHD